MKNEALELLDKIKPAVRDKVHAVKIQRGVPGKKPEDYSLIMGIIDAIDGTLWAKQLPSDGERGIQIGLCLIGPFVAF